MPRPELPSCAPPPLSPIRSVSHAVADGCRVLADRDPGYRDGGEAHLLEIVSAAEDLSSLSDELALACPDWPEYYSLSRSRANVLRGLTFLPTMRVLEVGAGCGPITRYLGEQCACVDALEPVLDRARVARARTRDLPNVEVFVGGLEDVPAKPTYDVIVVVGVLEYVGNGGAERAPYRAFLERCRQLLVDGGTLVLAIENPVGVKYLAGAPEDHSFQPFDGTEGYLREGHARTFGRPELENLFRAVGLTPRTLAAFPDYKLPRVLMADDLFEVAPSLAWRLPRFPSPDWMSTRPAVMDERRLWRSLVEAGAGPQTANSFVVVASHGSHGPRLWDHDLMAVYFNTERHSAHATATRVARRENSAIFERGPLSTATASPGLFTIEPTIEPLLEGLDLVDTIADNPGVDAGSLLRRWAEFLRASTTANGAPIDLVPRNMIVLPTGAVQFVDREATSLIDPGQALRRGVLSAAMELADRTPLERWPPACTVGDLACQLGQEVGLTGEWLEAALDEEAAVWVVLQGTAPSDERFGALLARQRADLAHVVATPLAHRGMNTRDIHPNISEYVAWATANEARLREQHDELDRLHRAATEYWDEKERVTNELAEAHAELTRIRQELASPHASGPWSARLRNRFRPRR